LALVQPRVDEPVAFVHTSDPDVTPQNPKDAHTWIPYSRAKVTPGATVLKLAPLTNYQLIACHGRAGETTWKVARQSVKAVSRWNGTRMYYDAADPDSVDALLETFPWPTVVGLARVSQLMSMGWDPTAPPAIPDEVEEGATDAPFDGPETDGE
jgi:hypothetical protein